MELTVSISQELRISIAPKMAWLFDLPSGELEKLIEDIPQNPDKYNSTNNSNGNGGIQSFFPIKSQGNSAPNKGVIIDIPLGAIPVPQNIEQAVDGIFYTQGAECQFYPSQYLREIPALLRLAQVPKQFKDAKKFLNFLINHKNWTSQKLRETYLALGKEQAEFIHSLDEQNLNHFQLTDLAETLGVNLSTAFRLARHRLVGIAKDNQIIVIPTPALLVNSNQFFYSVHYQQINQVLVEEAESGEALSDSKIAQKTKMIMRTIAKYRKMSGIPNHRERQVRYDSGDRTPYTVKGRLDKFLKK